MARRSSARVIASSALAIAGGILMVVGGVANHSFLLSLLSLVGGRLGTVLSGIPLALALLAISVVSLLISLGGLTVAAGGVLILTGHRTSGRLPIALGGGAGLLGLMISFGYTTFISGLADALSHSVYWIGLIMAVVARRIAKKT